LRDERSDEPHHPHRLHGGGQNDCRSLARRSSAANRALINDTGGCLVVWLDAPFALCWQRITNAADTRPLARSYDQAQALYRARHALYELAELRLPMPEERSADEAATEILSIIERRDFAR
jgi:shikimate kinase